MRKGRGHSCPVRVHGHRCSKATDLAPYGGCKKGETIYPGCLNDYSHTICLDGSSSAPPPLCKC